MNGSNDSKNSLTGKQQFCTRDFFHYVPLFLQFSLQCYIFICCLLDFTLKVAPYDTYEWKLAKCTNFKVSIFKSGVTVLMAKHDKLSLGIIYSVRFFQCIISLLAKEFSGSDFKCFIIICIEINECFVVNSKFLLSKCNGILAAVNHLFRLANTLLMEF